MVGHEEEIQPRPLAFDGHDGVDRDFDCDPDPDPDPGIRRDFGWLQMPSAYASLPAGCRCWGPCLALAGPLHNKPALTGRSETHLAVLHGISRVR